jgi:hypothetical protein
MIDDLKALLEKSGQTRARAWEMAGRKPPEAVNSLERGSNGRLRRVEANRLVRLLRPDVVGR